MEIIREKEGPLEINNFRYTLSLPEIEQLVSETIMRSGYKEGMVEQRGMYDNFRYVSELCYNTANPDLFFKIISDHELRSIFSENSVSLRSEKWLRLYLSMEGEKYIFCFALTLGEGLDDAIAYHTDHSILTGYLLDAAGSSLVELLANDIEKKINAYYTRLGYQTSRRFSPGYCDWNLATGQQDIFRILQLTGNTITMKEGGLLVPRKTITAIIGIARKVKIKTPCAFCTSISCKTRREAFDDYQFKKWMLEQV
jgi:hypothetical protein